MSDIKKLIVGIVLVVIAISMLLGSSSVLPWFGGVLGVGGVVLIIRAIKNL